MTPTEAHWQEAKEQYAKFRGILDEPYFPREDDWTQAMAQLVADGADTLKMAGTFPAKAELQAAADYSNGFIPADQTWRRTYEAVKDDRRWWCIASMMRSLGQSPASGDPLTDGERAALQAEIAELRAFKDGVQKLGGW